jgi:hypothetical protein
MKIKITEEDETHKKFYEEAKIQTLESFPEFLNKLVNDYEYDYGTICHAITAAAIGAAKSIDRSDAGGITGFQAGAIMWEFIKHWMHLDNELLRLINFDDMLFPQYAEKFEKTIPLEFAEYLVSEANKKLNEHKDAHPDVLAHWKNIAEGNMPFGYTVVNEDKP